MSSTHSVVSKIGHEEIDRQHLELERLIVQVDIFCADNAADADCGRCAQSQIDSCRRQASDIVRHLLKFVTQHFSYEEALMRRLPNNDECREHVRQHQKAHADMSASIARIAGKLRDGNPIVLGKEIRAALLAWTGSHTVGLDKRMVALGNSKDKCELSQDEELAVLLDRHA